MCAVHEQKRTIMMTISRETVPGEGSGETPSNRTYPEKDYYSFIRLD